MNCSLCRSHFSDYLDKALTPERARAMQTHLERCPNCATDLRELEVTLDHLRGMAAVPTPRRLASAVASRLRDTPLPSPTPRPKATTRSQREWRWSNLVAASLVVGAASFFAGHFAGKSAFDGDSKAAFESTAMELQEARKEVLGLETQLAIARATLAAENASLRVELASLKDSLEEWKAERAAALRVERRKQDDLARRLQDTVRNLETQAATLTAVEARLAATVEEKDALVGELAMSRQRLVSAQRSLPGRRVSATPWVKAVAEVGERNLTSAYRETPPVLCVRDGAGLRLKLRGTNEEIIPRLFVLAEDEAEPEIAGLALTTLETRLGRYAVAEAAIDSTARQDKPGLVLWFQRQVDGFSNTDTEETEEWEADRLVRLARFRRIWERRSVSPQ